MDFPNLKELKKLADTCRKAGIKHFKSDKFEFTLTDDLPTTKTKKAQENKYLDTVEQAKALFETDAPSDDELLFWSTGNTADSLGAKEE